MLDGPFRNESPAESRKSSNHRCPPEVLQAIRPAEAQMEQAAFALLRFKWSTLPMNKGQWSMLLLNSLQTLLGFLWPCMVFGT